MTLATFERCLKFLSRQAGIDAPTVDPSGFVVLNVGEDFSVDIGINEELGLLTFNTMLIKVPEDKKEDMFRCVLEAELDWNLTPEVKIGYRGEFEGMFLVCQNQDTTVGENEFSALVLRFLELSKTWRKRLEDVSMGIKAHSTANDAGIGDFISPFGMA